MIYFAEGWKTPVKISKEMWKVTLHTYSIKSHNTLTGFESERVLISMMAAV